MAGEAAVALVHVKHGGMVDVYVLFFVVCVYQSVLTILISTKSKKGINLGSEDEV